MEGRCLAWLGHAKFRLIAQQISRYVQGFYRLFQNHFSSLFHTKFYATYFRLSSYDRLCRNHPHATPDSHIIGGLPTNGWTPRCVCPSLVSLNSNYGLMALHVPILARSAPFELMRLILDVPSVSLILLLLKVVFYRKSLKKPSQIA